MNGRIMRPVNLQVHFYIPIFKSPNNLLAASTQTQAYLLLVILGSLFITMSPS